MGDLAQVAAGDALRTPSWREPRCLLLALAALALALVFLHPSWPVSRPALNYLFVVDITQSMNVRDYEVDGRPVKRLSRVKAALAQVLADLPCGSRVGLGLFTGWQPAVLFEPVEVCRHRGEIDGVIRHIDWRMAWIPQSNVARGLGNTLAIVRARPSLAGTALVFITDGDEAPDVRVSTERIPALRGDRAAGLLVGAGDVRPSAVPILNQWGRTTGYFQSGGNTYLSALQEEYLQNLAGQAGLDYMRLGERPGLTERLRSGRYARRVDKPGEASWVFGLLALGLLVAAYLPWPGRRRHR